MSQNCNMAQSASPSLPAALDDSLALTQAQRAQIAAHAERLTNARLLALLQQRAGQANAEYRFMDLMDRKVLSLAASLIVVGALYLGSAEMIVRQFARLGAAYTGPAIAIAWGGLLLGLPAYLGLRVAALRRRAMEVRRP